MDQAKNQNHKWICNLGLKEKYPEGGMNEKGLFIDAAALPEKISINKDPNKPDFDGYITAKVLQECSSVEQALDLVKRYNLTWQEKAQIMIVDKSGDYAVVHANYIIRRKAPAFVLTNYSIAEPGPTDFTCWRRNTVADDLKGDTLSVDLFRQSLSKVAQAEPDNATVYSQVCDLEDGTILLYQKHNFNQVAKLSLSEALHRGRSDIAMSALFPTGIGGIVTAEIQRHGIAQSLNTYARLKNSPKRAHYDFSESELDDAGYALLNAQKYKEAIAVFRLNTSSYPSSANATAGLANALLLQGNAQSADREYLKVRLADATNNYFNLFSHHPDHLIPFVIYGFDGAKSITLFLRNVASGSLITSELSSLRRGSWKATVYVPPGTYTYSFQVDDSFIVDPRNKLTKPVGNYLNSLFISR